MELREPAVVYGKKKFTEEEYFEIVRASQIKYEYYRGEIFAISGASYGHALISSNALIGLGIQLRGKKCHPFGSDLRIHIPQNTLYTYPSISIFCRNVIEENSNNDTIIEPTVLIEILSPSTRNYGHSEKFTLYKAIPTLKEYILINSETIQVKVFRLSEDGNWILQEYKNLTDMMEIKCLGVSLSLSIIYDWAKF